MSNLLAEPKALSLNGTNMDPSPSLNRRRWLQTTGTLLAGWGVSGRAAAAPGPGPAATGPARLSLNENPFGPAASAIAAMQAQLAFTHRYPSAFTSELTQAIAEKEGVSERHVLLGVGSGEILQAVGRWIGGMKGEVVTATPGYMQLVDVAQRSGARIIPVPVNDRLEHDLGAMAAKVGASTKLVYICNPNNPTGTLLPAADLRSFAIETSKRTTVFVDEAYLECSDDFSGNTMTGLLRDGHDVIIARTFSKIHGLAGQRIGYALMKPETAERVKSFMTGPTAMNLLGVVAARASLTDKAYVEATRLRIKNGRDQLLDVLASLKRRYAQPQGNFVFFHTGMPIADFQDRMRAEGVIVARPFPPLLDWCRITIGLPDEMSRVHQALRKILA